MTRSPAVHIRGYHNVKLWKSNYSMLNKGWRYLNVMVIRDNKVYMGCCILGDMPALKKFCPLRVSAKGNANCHTECAWYDDVRGECVILRLSDITSLVGAAGLNDDGMGTHLDWDSVKDV